LTGNYLGTPSGPALGGCSPTLNSGGSATFTFAPATSGTSTVTWNGAGTAQFHYTTSFPTAKKCPSGDVYVILHGAVFSTTPVGTGNGGVKGGIHAKICVHSSGDLSLLAGSGPFKL
jgi:hypothetical protein